MSNESRPRHLRHLPRSVKLTPEEEREHMDLQTDLDRLRREHLSEHPEGEEPWGFTVPRSMALLFDRLPSPFSRQQAVEAGGILGFDDAGVAEALEQMQRLELVSVMPKGFVKHPESKNWF
jgi:hypothetical protein